MKHSEVKLQMRPAILKSSLLVYSIHKTQRTKVTNTGLQGYPTLPLKLYLARGYGMDTEGNEGKENPPSASVIGTFEGASQTET